jgi:hypothetical protein
MTNMTVSNDLVLKIDRLKEVADHIRDLTAMKANLQAEILTELGADADTPAGTLSFTSAAGVVVAKVKVANELKIDHEAMAENLSVLKRRKLLGMVVMSEFKVDKRLFDKLEGDDLAALQGAVKTVKKKPTLEV